MTPLLSVTAHDRRTLDLGWRPLLANKFHEFWTKATGRKIKGQGMIGAEAHVVAAGFAALAASPEGADFATYNLPQDWVERRQIPRVLHQRVPARGATILDLGCGPATSTAVLAHFAATDWTIIGYDLIEANITRAQARAASGELRNRAGEAITPHFVCQDIAHPLRDPRGDPNTPAAQGANPPLLPDACADAAISGGVVGLYMQPDAVRSLAAELFRVLKPGGIAALDAGPATPAPRLRDVMRCQGFTFLTTAKSFVIEPRPKLIFEKPAAR